MNHAKAAVVLFAKHPSPGGVKTRLVPPLTPEQAAELYEAMLFDTLEWARALTDLDLVLAYTPEIQRGYFEPIAEDFTLLAQRGEGLAERMAAAFEDLFKAGHPAVIAVGTDHPHLDPLRVREAVERLADADLVLGPTPDGGYYLVGLRRPHRDLFVGLPMSEANLYEATIQVAEAKGLKVAALKEEYDLDYAADLERLAGEPGERASRTRHAWARLMKAGEPPAS